MKFIFSLGLLVLFTLPVRAQDSFENINRPLSPHVTALGGQVITATSFIPGLFLENPGLLSDSTDNYIGLSYMRHPAMVNHSMLASSWNLPSIGNIGFTFRRVGYGKIDGYDESGTYTGQFESSETMIGLTKSWSSGNFSLGSTLKWITSSIGGYTANSLMLDIGGVFVHPQKELVVGIAVRNAGFILSDYTGTSSSSLPFEVKTGVTYKPQYMPFRTTLTLYNIGSADSQLYEDDLTTGLQRATSFVNLGLELVLNDNLQLLGGYNFLKRYELRLPANVYGAGWSAGLRFSKKDVNFEYGFARQHAAGSIHHVSVTINAKQLIGLKRNTNE